jgi:hypothetical protein
MPPGWVSGRQARSKSASVPGLSWRVVIHTTCSSIVASSRYRRGGQPIGASAASNTLSGGVFSPCGPDPDSACEPGIRRLAA